MKLKNSEVVARAAGLAEIINRGVKYPVAFSFGLSKNMRALENLNKDFEESRNRLLDEYNVKDENGKPAYLTTGKIEISKEHEDAWKKAMSELLNIEVEFEVHKVELSVLDGINIEADVLYLCDFMLE